MTRFVLYGIPTLAGLPSKLAFTGLSSIRTYVPMTIGWETAA